MVKIAIQFSFYHKYNFYYKGEYRGLPLTVVFVYDLDGAYCTELNATSIVEIDEDQIRYEESTQSYYYEESDI